MKRIVVQRQSPVDQAYNQSHFLYDESGGGYQDDNAFQDHLQDKMASLGDGPLDLQEFFEGVIALKDFSYEDIERNISQLTEVLKKNMSSEKELSDTDEPTKQDLYQPSKVLHILVNDYGKQQALESLLELYKLTEKASLEMYCIGAYLHEIANDDCLSLRVYTKQFLGEEIKKERQFALSKGLKQYLKKKLDSEFSLEKKSWILSQFTSGA